MAKAGHDSLMNGFNPNPLEDDTFEQFERLSSTSFHDSFQLDSIFPLYDMNCPKLEISALNMPDLEFASMSMGSSSDLNPNESSPINNAQPKQDICARSVLNENNQALYVDAISPQLQPYNSSPSSRSSSSMSFHSDAAGQCNQQIRYLTLNASGIFVEVFGIHQDEEIWTPISFFDENPPTFTAARVPWAAHHKLGNRQGLGIRPQLTWKYKNRQVLGVPANFNNSGSHGKDGNPNLRKCRMIKLETRLPLDEDSKQPPVVVEVFVKGYKPHSKKSSCHRCIWIGDARLARNKDKASAFEMVGKKNAQYGLWMFVNGQFVPHNSEPWSFSVDCTRPAASSSKPKSKKCSRRAGRSRF